MLIRALISVHALLLTTIVMVVPSHAASTGASTTIPIGYCNAGVAAPDGSTRQAFESVKVSNAISAIPPRSEVDVKPGGAESVCVGFQNRTGEPIDLTLGTYNIGYDDDGAPLTMAENATYGAGEWVQLPTTRVRNLAHGDIAWLLARVVIPPDAAAGSWYASVRATYSPPSTDAGDGIQIGQSSAVISQVFINIPGERVNDGRVVKPSAPRVVWWDGLGIGDIPILDRLRGSDVATFRFGWENKGTVTDLVKGEVVVRSDLGGRTVASLPVEEATIMRGATRAMRTTWSKDIPMVGRFTPTARMTDVSGETREFELDPIWVIPAWWYIIAVIAAIAIPVGMRRRNRRRYRALLERVEAAEHAAADDADMDSDSDDDPWHDDAQTNFS